MAVKKFLKQVANLFDLGKRKCKNKKVCMEEAVARLQARQMELDEDELNDLMRQPS